MMTAQLSGQVAVITGASSGIGRAVALACAKAGLQTCLVGRNADTLEAVAAEVQFAGSRIVCCRADLAQDKDIQAVRDCVAEHFQRVDILVHSAGVIAHGAIADAPVEEFDRQYQTNVRSPYVLTQQLLPWLKANQGQIVFINSSLGVSARGGVGPYAATKHALKALADSLREEVNGDGVRVLSLFLGRTATPLQASVHRLENQAYRPERLIQPEDIAAVLLHAIQLPKTAEITDIHVRPMQKPTR
jgi:NADP-dependent 3-hydroxy acid dehydrogenase YdfG